MVVGVAEQCSYVETEPYISVRGAYLSTLSVRKRCFPLMLISDILFLLAWIGTLFAIFYLLLHGCILS
jgi:hypothetical protein